jgi:hypothetical protein
MFGVYHTIIPAQTHPAFSRGLLLLIFTALRTQTDSTDSCWIMLQIVVALIVMRTTTLAAVSARIRDPTTAYSNPVIQSKMVLRD